MPELYLFTWNVGKNLDAHDLAVEHLAEQASNNKFFIGCFQELPQESAIAKARTSGSDELKKKGLCVVESGRSRGAALVHHHAMQVAKDSVFADDEGEFVAAVFQMPSSPITVGVINLHATSRATARDEIDCAGNRALLRQAINERRIAADHLVVMGDWNSQPHDKELSSYHCFYALIPNIEPVKTPSWRLRRKLEHPPLHIPVPLAPHGHGTYVHVPSQSSQSAKHYLYDFMAFRDKQSIHNKKPQIITHLAATEVWNETTRRPCVSDHLPVEGFLAL